MIGRVGETGGEPAYPLDNSLNHVDKHSVERRVRRGMRQGELVEQFKAAI